MSRTCVDAHHCITCSDEGIAMRVVSVNVAFGSAMCVAAQPAGGGAADGGAADGGAAEAQEILTGLVSDIAPGDVILVHAGAALVRLGSHAVSAANTGGQAA